MSAPNFQKSFKLSSWIGRHLLFSNLCDVHLTVVAAVVRRKTKKRHFIMWMRWCRSTCCNDPRRGFWLEPFWDPQEIMHLIELGSFFSAILTQGNWILIEWYPNLAWDQVLFSFRFRNSSSGGKGETKKEPKFSATTWGKMYGSC